MPTKVWAEGEEVLAADFNPMVQEQVIPTFANASARDAAMPTPHIGQHCYLNDQRVLLQYTDLSVTPGWHRPWQEPWGFIKQVEVPDFRFGGWTGIAGTDHYFPVRNRLIRVTFNCSIYKDIDGGDAHCVIRMNASNGSQWIPVYDALVTLHQGWVGRPDCHLILDSAGWQGVWFHALATYGTAVTQWTRLSMEDLGPIGTPVMP